MMTRPVFESPDVPELIERIRTDDTVFTIEPCPNSDYLELRCYDSNLGSDFCFYMNYTTDLADSIGHEIQYENGMILFTDHMKPEDVIAPILETDYITSLDEDVEECPVCYELYEPMIMSLCGHNACNDCMIKMGSNGLTKCPICRSDRFKYPIAVVCDRSFVSV
jgi:hypothetical protein